MNVAEENIELLRRVLELQTLNEELSRAVLLRTRELAASQDGNAELITRNHALYSKNIELERALREALEQINRKPDEVH